MVFQKFRMTRLPASVIGLVALVGLAIFVLGCGQPASERVDIAKPPQHGAELEPGAELDGTADAVPPSGGIEMPPGEISATLEEADGEKSGGIEMPKGITVPEADGAAAAPTIEYRSWAEVESLAKSSGRVTVVDLWSLACEPCLKEFPGLVRLHQTMGTKVQCIAVDLDFDGRQSRPPQHYEEQVVAFLKSVNASGFPTYISTTASDDVFSSAKLPSIPAVLVFDTNGELAKAFVDAGDTAGFTYEKDVFPLVTKLAE